MINDLILLKRKPNNEEQPGVVMGLQTKPLTLSKSLFPQDSMVDLNCEKTFCYFVQSGKIFVVKGIDIPTSTYTWMHTGKNTCMH